MTRWTPEECDKVVELRELAKFTFRQIGELYGCDRERVRQAYNKARRSKRYWQTHTLDDEGNTVRL